MDLKELLEQRRNNGGNPIPYRHFAKQLGIGFTDLYRFVNGERGLALPRIRRIAQIAKEQNDSQMLDALAEYALGVSL